MPTITNSRISPGKFVLGVDLDGVCADFEQGFRAHAARITGRSVDAFSIARSFDLVEAGWFADRHEFNRVFNRAIDEGLFVDLRVIDGCAETLARLRRSGATIRIVTARRPGAMAVSDTALWLDGAGIEYDDLCFTSDKTAVGTDLHIDDAPHVLEAMRDAGRNAIVLDQPYNQDSLGIRASNWRQVEEIVGSVNGLMEDGVSRDGVAA